MPRLGRTRGGRAPRSAAGRAVPLGGASDAEAAAEYRSVLEHRLQYLVPVDQPLVLIAQPGRSGGTLLLRLFDGHPQCHVVPYELQQMFRGMSKLDGPGAAWEWLAGDKQFLRRRPFLLRPSLQRAIFDRCLGERSNLRPREVMDCWFTSYFNAWLDNANLRAGAKRWVVGFEPEATTKLAAHARLYPDGRVISVVRDPWSWYASRRKEPKWRELPVAIDSWRAHVSAALELLDSDPERVMLVLFSDLLSATERTMRRLGGWLGLDFDPVLLAPTFNRLPVAARSSFGDVGTQVSEAPLDRRAALTGGERESIAARAGDLFARAVEQMAVSAGGPG